MLTKMIKTALNNPKFLKGLAIAAFGGTVAATVVATKKTVESYEETGNRKETAKKVYPYWIGVAAIAGTGILAVDRLYNVMSASIATLTAEVGILRETIDITNKVIEDKYGKEEAKDIEKKVKVALSKRLPKEMQANASNKKDKVLIKLNFGDDSVEYWSTVTDMYVSLFNLQEMAQGIYGPVVSANHWMHKFIGIPRSELLDEDLFFSPDIYQEEYSITYAIEAEFDGIGRPCLSVYFRTGLYEFENIDKDLLIDSDEYDDYAFH